MSDRNDRIERLGEALARIRSPFDEDEAVSIAMEGARLAAEDPSRGARGAGRRPGDRGGLRRAIDAAAAGITGLGPRSRYALAATAAVAVVAVLALPSPDPVEPDAARLVAPPTATAATDEFSIEAPEEGGMAVFQTNNPRIRVVWFYDAAGSGD